MSNLIVKTSKKILKSIKQFSQVNNTNGENNFTMSLLAGGMGTMYAIIHYKEHKDIGNSKINDKMTKFFIGTSWTGAAYFLIKHIKSK